MSPFDRDHKLRSYGAPHNKAGKILTERGGKSGRASTAGEGHAVCSCGEISPSLPDGATRRDWHKLHKDEAMTKTPETKLQVQGDVYAVQVPFPRYFARHFFDALGKYAGEQIVMKIDAALDIDVDKPAVIFIDRDPKVCKAAAKCLTELWKHCYGAVPEWKDLKGKVQGTEYSQQGKVSIHLKRRFYRELVTEFVDNFTFPEM